MKKGLVSLIAAVFAFFGSKSQTVFSFSINNNPLPQDTLRVLMVGNSFTDDVVSYIDDIVSNTDIDRNTCCIYTLTQGGAQLMTWYYKYAHKEAVSIYRKTGDYQMPVEHGSMEEIFSQPWDVVSFQQVSTLSTDIRTFSPYLEKLITYARQNCTNEQLAFCWHLTWSYWEGEETKGPKEKQGWENIVTTAEEMIENFGINIIIPSGTAIQNARNTKLNTKLSITRDGRHIGNGTGQYIIGCTLFESLFEPVYGVSILGNPFKYDKATEEMQEEAQNCALDAVRDWHTLSRESEENEEEPIILFPNPARDNLYLKFLSSKKDKINITLLDNMGKTKLQKELPTNYYNLLDISSFQKGIYMLVIKEGWKKHSYQIEKQ